MITVQDIHRELGLKTKQSVVLIDLLLQYVQLFDKKQLAYGPGNIADFGELGVLVRANDKMRRLKHILYEGGEAGGETVEDTWQDLLGYAAIALLVRRGQWDKQQ